MWCPVMNKPNRADVRQANVRVSGITFESVRVRHDLGANDFDIVIDDPQVGRFALTRAVPDLELRDEDSDWRQVTLDELTNSKGFSRMTANSRKLPKSRRRPKPLSASHSTASLRRANT